MASTRSWSAADVQPPPGPVPVERVGRLELVVCGHGEGVGVAALAADVLQPVAGVVVAVPAQRLEQRRGVAAGGDGLGHRGLVRLLQPVQAEAGEQEHAGEDQPEDAAGSHVRRLDTGACR